MIKPHGSEQLNPLYVMDDAKRAALQQEAESLPSILGSSAAAANAETPAMKLRRVMPAVFRHACFSSIITPFHLG